MTNIILVLHVLVAFMLVIIVLLQTGKGASMGAAFGGSSQTIFGPTGATSFLHKLTTIAAIVFMLTSLGLAMKSSRKQIKIESVTTQEESARETRPQALPPQKGGSGEEGPSVR